MTYTTHTTSGTCRSSHFSVDPRSAPGNASHCTTLAFDHSTPPVLAAPGHEYSSSRSTTPKAIAALLITHAPTPRPDKTPTPQTYKDLLSVKRTPPDQEARTIPVPPESLAGRARTDAHDQVAHTGEWPALPSRVQRTRPLQQSQRPVPLPVYQSWANFQTKLDDLRVKPAWIYGSLTPPVRESSLLQS